MKARRYVQLGVLLAVLLVFEQSGIAALVSGSVNFNVDGKLDGYIDYAVYEPGDYDGSVTFKNLYVYAYQIFSEDSAVSIDFFSVGLPSDVQVYNALYDSSTGGIAPSMSLVLPESVLYVFQFDNIGANEHSKTLLFTSDCSPEMAKGVVSSGIAGGVIVDVPSPSPVPEPATLALISGGAFLALRRKRNV